MDLGLSGKVALVLGGSQGIGRATALAFAREGASVAVCGRDAERLDAVRMELEAGGAAGVLAIRADVTDAGDIARLVDGVASRFGTVHVLVNNAAGPKPGMSDDLDDADWERAFRLTLMSAVRATRAVLPHMRRQGWGRIVNIGSYSVKQPIDELLLSNSLRLAALGWSKTLANQVAREGILVNTVCPGWTLTDRLKQIVSVRAADTGRSVEETAGQITRDIPVGRFAAPEEVADLIVFLASERAGYVTGTVIPVDGGIVRSPL